MFVRGTVLAAALVAATPTGAQPGWERDVVNLISAEQAYPRSAVKRGQEGTVTIRVFVAPDGSVSNVELVKPSGSAILDREALRMPAKAGRLPARPSGAQGSVEIPVTFRLSE